MKERKRNNLQPRMQKSLIQKEIIHHKEGVRHSKKMSMKVQSPIQSKTIHNKAFQVRHMVQLRQVTKKLQGKKFQEMQLHCKKRQPRKKVKIYFQVNQPQGTKQVKLIQAANHPKFPQ